MTEAKRDAPAQRDGGLGWEWGLRGIFREDGVGKGGSGSRARAELEGGRCGPEEATPQGPGGRSEEGTWFGGEAGWGLSRGRAWPRATVQGQQWSGRCEPEEGRGPRSQDSHGAARFTDVALGMTVLMAVGDSRAPAQRDPVCNYLGRYLAIPVSYERQPELLFPQPWHWPIPGRGDGFPGSGRKARGSGRSEVHQCSGECWPGGDAASPSPCATQPWTPNQVMCDRRSGRAAADARQGCSRVKASLGALLRPRHKAAAQWPWAA